MTNKQLVNQSQKDSGFKMGKERLLIFLQESDEI